jgi:ribose 1,5-bisphosphokinase
MAKIIYIMGPSGSGKDSIINAVRQQSLDNLQVAHRYITRHWQSGGENHVALSESEYNKRQALGLFALAWSANQHQYAIGCEIDVWLKAGQNVLVNGSRAYLEQARARYANDIYPVLIDVEAHKLEQRLIERGRETQQQIQARIIRHQQYRHDLDSSCDVIDNNHSIDDAMKQVCAIIKRVTHS